jgi:amidase
MAFKEYGDHDAVGLAALVRKKQVSAGELLDEAIERTTKVDPKINAVVVKHYDYAKRQIDQGLPDGPFTGVPFLLKDLEFLEGTRAPHRGRASTGTILRLIPAPSPGASSTRASRSSAKARARSSD